MRRVAVFLTNLFGAAFVAIDALMIIYAIYDRFFGYSLFIYWIGNGDRFMTFIVFVSITFAAVALLSISLKFERKGSKKEESLSLFLAVLLAVVVMFSVVDQYKKSIVKTRCVKMGTHSDFINGKVDVCQKFQPVTLEKEIEAKNVKVKECFFGSGTIVEGECQVVDNKKLKISITSCDEYGANLDSVSCRAYIKLDTDKGMVTAGEIFVPVYIETPKVRIK